MREELTFEDGIILCKYIFQSAIDKTLNGVMEQEEIFYRAYEQLSKIEKNFNKDRLDEILRLLNIENVYSVI